MQLCSRARSSSAEYTGREPTGRHESRTEVGSLPVSQRQREIAVRVALGAVRGDILRVAIRQAISPAFVGLALGVLGASLATRLLSTFLVDIQPIDPPTFAAASGVLALAALVAGI